MVILCLLVGGGTDGASVNVGVHSGLKTRVQHALPWVYWSWCYTHRLELACKDAFTSPFFTSISEMLMRLYYVYEKSAKKIPRTCRFCRTEHFLVSSAVQGGKHKRRALRILDR